MDSIGTVDLTHENLSPDELAAWDAAPIHASLAHDMVKHPHFARGFFSRWLKNYRANKQEGK